MLEVMRDILQSRYLRSYVAHKQLARTSLKGMAMKFCLKRDNKKNTLKMSVSTFPLSTARFLVGSLKFASKRSLWGRELNGLNVQVESGRRLKGTSALAVYT